jgi:GNAT superfamily N-acetyltransferase
MMIRRATTEDVAAIRRIYTQAVLESAPEHYSPDQIQALVKSASQGFQGYSPSHDDQVVLVAEDPEGNVIGYAHLDQQRAGVEAVFVHPDHWRRGVGSRLMQALEEVGRQAGLTELNLDAMLNAVAFYEHAGYQAERQMNYPLHGVEIPCVFMTKTLV